MLVCRNPAKVGGHCWLIKTHRRKKGFKNAAQNDLILIMLNVFGQYISQYISKACQLNETNVLQKIVVNYVFNVN